ncbi:hypothetical protein, partial [Serratia marcescens]|uniref:hypothetical protein n=1 Tax=Serratia marcescens TaxID=615 RepID=UPI0028140421
TVKGEPYTLSAPSSSHVTQEVELNGFNINAIDREGKFLPSPDFRLYSIPTWNMMHRMHFFPGIGLGLFGNGILTPPLVVVKHDTFGLGYRPAPGEVSGKGELTQPIQATLNDRFVKEGECVTYCGFPEPFISSHSHKLLPGLEIFQDCMPKPKLFVHDNRTTETEGGHAGAVPVRGCRKEQRTDNTKEQLQRMFGSATTPDDLIFSDDEG